MRLATRVWGNGPCRIGLIHGISGSAELWTDFAELIAQRHGATVIAVDQRGHGASGPAETYRLDDFADDAVATLPTGLDMVIGHSLGGRVLAVAVERLAPAHAVYLDPAFGLPLTGRRLGRALVGSRPVVRATAWQLVRPVPGVAIEIAERYRRAARAWDAGMTRSIVREQLVPLAIAPPAVPSTVLLSTAILGRRSLLVSPRQAARLRAAGWDVRVLSGSVHDLPGLHPRETADALARLLDAAGENPGSVGGRL